MVKASVFACRVIEFSVGAENGGGVLDSKLTVQFCSSEV